MRLRLCWCRLLYDIGRWLSFDAIQKVYEQWLMKSWRYRLLGGVRATYHEDQRTMTQEHQEKDELSSIGFMRSPHYHCTTVVSAAARISLNLRHRASTTPYYSRGGNSPRSVSSAAVKFSYRGETRGKVPAGLNTVPLLLFEK